MKDIDFDKLLSKTLDEMNEKQPHDLQEELDIIFRLFEKEFQKWKKRFIKNIFEKINKKIKEEKRCMKQDKYEEQEIEHINQIEMANKIKQIIKKEIRRLK